MCKVVLWAESILIPNANDGEIRTVDMESLAKHCPGIPLSIINR